MSSVRNGMRTRDPSFNFDRHGFRINPRDERAASELEDPSLLRKENTRLLKWQEMITEWDMYAAQKRAKVTSRAWKGVPDPVRAEVWRRQSAAPTAPPHRRYQQLRTTQLPERTLQVIQRDVMRTFPNHEQFLKRADDGEMVPDEDGRAKLEALLCAYAAIDPECGYVNGMSYIAAVPMFYMPEEEAFWTFVYLMVRQGYREYFLPHTPQLVRSQMLLEALVKEKLPKLHNRLTHMNIRVSDAVAPWFLTIFTFSLPFPIAVKCWDWLFIVGHDSLFAVALCVLKLCQDKLLRMKGDTLVEGVMAMSSHIEIDARDFVKTVQQYKSIGTSISRILDRRPNEPQLVTVSDAERNARWMRAVSGE